MIVISTGTSSQSEIDRAILKQRFSNGCIPTEEDYADFIDKAVTGDIDPSTINVELIRITNMMSALVTDRFTDIETGLPVRLRGQLEPQLVESEIMPGTSYYVMDRIIAYFNGYFYDNKLAEQEQSVDGVWHDTKVIGDDNKVMIFFSFSTEENVATKNLYGTRRLDIFAVQSSDELQPGTYFRENYETGSFEIFYKAEE